ncbi:beta-1,3-galactosyltransferase 2 [Poeciliopsis prolifica]|uniref:beta-1,3-galactosyltransferase 2 n=1 Tax=Poeciliopsis prolifica TaxID=188132 RepID=UPI00072D46F9|nr:beta-1,3-galactosyltransferase 2 [Poeciliopsis prolifica]
MKASRPEAMRMWVKFLCASGLLLLSALYLLGSVRDTAKKKPLPAEEYRLISPLTYRYLLNQPQVCQGRSPFLVFLVPVAPQEAEARQAVRRTWGAPGRDSLTLFFSGLPKGALLSPLQRVLEKESQQHGDIIQMDFLDSYQNLTIKTMMMMKWLADHCPNSFYAMKVDSDIFVNVFYLIQRLRSSPRVGFITGSVIWDGSPRRDPSSKWYLSKELYLEDDFPPYVSGAGYVFSTDLAAKISWASRFVRVIPLEDVYVGLCLRVLGVRPVYSYSLPRFRNLFEVRKLEYDRCTFAELIIVNKFKPAELLRMWQDFSEGQADC